MVEIVPRIREPHRAKGSSRLVNWVSCKVQPKLSLGAGRGLVALETRKVHR